MSCNTKPNIWSDKAGTGDSSGGTLPNLTLGGLYKSTDVVRNKGGNNLLLKFVEKSDYLIVVKKPSNVGGAKEVTR
jgi:hypothetical protein